MLGYLLLNISKSDTESSEEREFTEFDQKTEFFSVNERTISTRELNSFSIATTDRKYEAPNQNDTQTSNQAVHIQNTTSIKISHFQTSTSTFNHISQSLIQSNHLTTRPAHLPIQRLLPSQLFLNPTRITLVLDLDETLSHSILDSAYVGPFDYAFQTVWNWEEVNVKVCFRPHLHSFLQFVCSHFEVVVFTASLPQFANPVLDKLDPEGQIFSHRLFRDSCSMHGGIFIKDLASLNRQLSPSSSWTIVRILTCGIREMPFLSRAGILIRMTANLYASRKN